MYTTYTLITYHTACEHAMSILNPRLSTMIQQNVASLVVVLIHIIFNQVVIIVVHGMIELTEEHQTQNKKSIVCLIMYAILCFKYFFFVHHQIWRTDSISMK